MLETLIGFTLCIIGIWTGNIFFKNFQNASPLFLAVSIAFLFLGVCTLFKAGRRDKHIPHFKHTGKVSSIEDKKSILEKNNDMLSSYIKTSDMRDKLRIIKKIG